MSVTAAQGFVAAGIHAGIKPSGNPDLSLVATEDGAVVSVVGLAEAPGWEGAVRVAREDA